MILLDGVFLLLFLSLCAGAGLTVLRALRVPLADRSEAAFFGLGVGYFLAAHMVVALGLVGCLAPAGLWAALVLLAVLSLPGFRAYAAYPSPLRPPEAAPRLARVLMALLAVFFIASLVFAYAPPRTGDELFYHLNIPKRSLAAGRFAAFPEIPFSYLPMTFEAGVTFLLGLRNIFLARALNGAFAAVAALALGGFAAGRLKVPWVWAAALFYFTPITLTESGVGNSDFLTIFYLVLLVWALERVRDGRQRGWLGLAAFCAGAAASVKHQAIPLAAAAVLVNAPFLWGWLRRDGRAALAGTVCFAAAWGYTPIHNTILIGNPIHPLEFGAGPAQDFFALLLQESRTARTLGNFFVLLGRLAPGAGLMDGVGPVFLVLLPGLVFWPRRAAPERRVLATAGFAYALTFLLFAVDSTPRFFLGSSALLFCLEACVLQDIWRAGAPRWTGWALIAGFAPALGLSILGAGNRWRFALGLESADAFMCRAHYASVPWSFIKDVNARVASDDRVFFLGPNGQSFYWDFLPRSLDQRALWENPDPAAAARALRETGATLFIFPGPHWKLLPQGRRLIDDMLPIEVPWLTDDFLRNCFEPVLERGGFVLYRWKGKR